MKNLTKLIGHVDFSNATLTATFGGGMITSNVMVPVYSDNVVEEPEKFKLILNAPSSLDPAITASDSAVGVITDSTSKY